MLHRGRSREAARFLRVGDLACGAARPCGPTAEEGPPAAGAPGAVVPATSVLAAVLGVVGGWLAPVPTFASPQAASAATESRPQPTVAMLRARPIGLG